MFKFIKKSQKLKFYHIKLIKREPHIFLKMLGHCRELMYHISAIKFRLIHILKQ